MKEVWKKIDGYDYEISNYGKCYSTRRGKEVKKNGRNEFVFYKKRVREIVSACRLVAEYFVPNPNNQKYVRHKDGNRNNNRADNLYWSDYKMNKKVVLTSKSGFHMEFDTMKQVAMHFGVSQQTVTTCVTLSGGYYKGFKVDKIKE